MRAELAEVTAGLLLHLPGVPHEIDDEIKHRLMALACLASQGRSPVQRDFKGEIDLVLDAEAPTRIIKQLGQLWRACGMLGLSRDESWAVVRRAGLDSLPKLRGGVIRYLASRELPQATTDVGIAMAHPTRSVRRALEDLAAHHVITRIAAGQGRSDAWAMSRQARQWCEAIGTLPEMAKGSAEASSPGSDDRAEKSPGTDFAIAQETLAISGTPLCDACGASEDSIIHGVDCLGEDGAA